MFFKKKRSKFVTPKVLTAYYNKIMMSMNEGQTIFFLDLNRNLA